MKVGTWIGVLAVLLGSFSVGLWLTTGDETHVYYDMDEDQIDTTMVIFTQMDYDSKLHSVVLTDKKLRLSRSLLLSGIWRERDWGWDITIGKYSYSVFQSLF